MFVFPISNSLSVSTPALESIEQVVSESRPLIPVVTESFLSNDITAPQELIEETQNALSALILEPKAFGLYLFHEAIELNILIEGSKVNNADGANRKMQVRLILNNELKVSTITDQLSLQGHLTDLEPGTHEISVEVGLLVEEGDVLIAESHGSFQVMRPTLNIHSPLYDSDVVGQAGKVIDIYSHLYT
jgi:hypothetical protein